MQRGLHYSQAIRNLEQPFLMFKALTKTRPANFYANQVKVLLLIVIGVLIYQSDDARFFISDRLNDASEMIRPDAKFEVRF